MAGRPTEVSSDGDLREPDCARQLLRSLLTVRAVSPRPRSGLSGDDLAELHGVGVRSSCTAGAAVLASTAADSPLVVLVHGSASVGRQVAGRRVVTEILAPSSVFGASHKSDIVALTPVETLVVPARKLRAHIAQRPRTALAIVAALQHRLDAVDADRAAAARLDTLARVVRVLLRLAERHGRATSDGLAIDLPLTQRDLADLACASAKATATALQRLRSEGAVRTARRQIVLSDGEALVRIAQRDGWPEE